MKTDEREHLNRIREIALAIADSIDGKPKSLDELCKLSDQDYELKTAIEAAINLKIAQEPL